MIKTMAAIAEQATNTTSIDKERLCEVSIFSDDDIPNFYALLSEVNMCVKLKEEK